MSVFVEEVKERNCAFPLYMLKCSSREEFNDFCTLLEIPKSKRRGNYCYITANKKNEAVLFGAIEVK